MAADQGAATAPCPDCFGKGFEGQDDRPGLLLDPERGTDECRRCHGTGRVPVAAFGCVFARETIEHAFPGVWQSWSDDERAKAATVAEHHFRPIFERFCDDLAALVNDFREALA